MNKTIFMAAVLAAATAFSVIATPLVYAQDTSETSTDQDVKQKNTGSGESVNFNCGENLIKAGVEDQECEFDEGGTSDNNLAATETDDAAATEDPLAGGSGADMTDQPLLNLADLFDESD
jgi:hypothetical protein